MNPDLITGNHVFIIEDDAVMQYVLKRAFAHKCLVTMFSNGQAALTALQSGVVPDLIITDVNTPVLNGLQLLSKIRNNMVFGQVPVMVMSADNSPEMKAKSMAAGATGYIVKPFDPRELVERAGQLLDSFAQQPALLQA